MEQEVTYKGVDVAKAQLDVAVRPSGARWDVSRDEAGVRLASFFATDVASWSLSTVPSGTKILK